MTMIRDNFLVDLDSVFDSRLAVITSMYGEKYAKQLYTDDVYDKRIADIFNVFPGMHDFNQQRFKERYDTRTVKDLETSAKATRISNALNCHAAKLKLSAGRIDYIPKPVISINVYPYVFNKDFISEDLKPAMEFLFHEYDEVHIVNLPLSLITPAYLKANHSDVVMYDLEAWLKINAEVLRKYPIPSIQFTVPLKAIKEEVDGIVTSGSAPATIKTLLAQVINLEFEPLEAFSMDIENMILARNNEED